MCVHVALEDDTDELLELIEKSDRLLTPTRHHGHTPGLLVKRRQGSSPYSARLHSSESHSCSDSDSNKSARFCDEAEAYSGLKVKGNFTPAPVVSQSNQPHPSNSDLPPAPAALKELVQIMQGYADTFGIMILCNDVFPNGREDFSIASKILLEAEEMKLIA